MRTHAMTSQVEEVFMVPIKDLLDPAKRSNLKGNGPTELTKFVLTAGTGAHMPVFLGGPHRIWGLTAYVLNGILNSVLFPQHSGAKL